MAGEDHTARGNIVPAILVAQDCEVLLDVDLAQLYGVTTGALNQAVMRHLSARTNTQIMGQLERLEARVGGHDADIPALLRAMRELIGPARTPSRGIGFLADIK